MNEQYVGGLAVWRFELDHIQVPVRSLRPAEPITAVISVMAYPANKVCVVILAKDDAIGFPPVLLEDDIIRTVRLVAVSTDLSNYCLKGQIASVDGQRVTIELALCKVSSDDAAGGRLP